MKCLSKQYIFFYNWVIYYANLFSSRTIGKICQKLTQKTTAQPNLNHTDTVYMQPQTSVVFLTFLQNKRNRTVKPKPPTPRLDHATPRNDPRLITQSNSPSASIIIMRCKISIFGHILNIAQQIRQLGMCFCVDGNNPPARLVSSQLPGCQRQSSPVESATQLNNLTPGWEKLLDR